MPTHSPAHDSHSGSHSGSHSCIHSIIHPRNRHGNSLVFRRIFNYAFTNLFGDVFVWGRCLSLSQTHTHAQSFSRTHLQLYASCPPCAATHSRSPQPTTTSSSICRTEESSRHAVRLPACLSVCLPACCPSLCLRPLCPPVRLSIHLFAGQSVSKSVKTPLQRCRTNCQSS